MTDESSDVRVRPLDPSGNPIVIGASGAAARRGSLFVGAAIAAIVIVAIAAVLAWRAFIGSPYAAAEAVPADADIVVTMDFLQIRDLDRVDRFIRAFADPLQQHGMIDEIPDLETALQEFDDLTEKESGFRFAEDILGWVGRSGSIAVWIPDSMLTLDDFAEPATPMFLATVEVRDEPRAAAFLDRAIAEAERAGVAVERIQVAGSAAYYLEAADAPVVVALTDGRFLMGDSTATVRRAIELAPSDSVAQRDDFQELASVLSGEPLMTFFTSPTLGDQLVQLNATLGVESPFPDHLGSSMATLTLDDDGIAIRASSRAPDGLTVAAGRWAGRLPSDTYGFIDVALPDRYLESITGGYTDNLAGAGLTEQDLAMLTEPADAAIGMSLIDDLLPQFGGEMLFAALPASDGVLVEETGVDIAMLFGIGVDDASVVGRALDNALSLLVDQGLAVRQERDLRIVDVEGVPVGAVAVTDDALFAASSPTALIELLDGSGGLDVAERYRRVDDLVAGEGLAMYIDIAALMSDFVADEAARDVLAPLVAAGAGYRIQGELQVVDFRLVVDY